MKNQKLKEIKNIYQKYLNKEASILELANLFNIKLDETRLDDYVIKRIFIENIEIEDTKNKINYKSAISSHASLLNMIGPGMKWLNIEETSLDYKKEFLYDTSVSEIEPIVYRITLPKDEYLLCFQKEKNEVGKFFTIRYIKSYEYNGKMDFERLLSKEYVKIENNCSLKMIETYSADDPRNHDNRTEKYVYNLDNNIIYGVSDFKEKDICSNFKGFCFEKTNDTVKKYVPLGMMYESNYEGFFEPNTISIIAFQSDYQHRIEIYKDDKNLNINYFTLDNNGKEKNRKYKLPKLSSGTINNDEIDALIKYLKSSYSNYFIQIVCDNLLAFKEEIDIKNKVKNEEKDPLAPNNFTNKDDDELFNDIFLNKDAYFDIADKEFHKLDASKYFKDSKSKLSFIKRKKHTM